MVLSNELSDELLKKAMMEVNEDPKRRDQDIQHIREWLMKQPHINARMDDLSILGFLRGCKFSLEKTKHKLDMYYTYRTLLPEWFSNRDPLDPDLKAVLELGGFLPLPGFDEQGRKVLLIRSGLHDVNKVSVDMIMKIGCMVGEVAFRPQPDFQFATGIVEIVDLSKSEPRHGLQYTPLVLKKIMSLAQDAYPMRLKAIHYIHTPASFHTIINLFGKFLKEKLRKRVYVHGNSLESLHKTVSKHLLPEEYGGTNGSVEDIKNYWTQKVIENRDFFLDDEKYRVDESKRPGKPKTTNDLFGIDGSFRKLEVD